MKTFSWLEKKLLKQCIRRMPTENLDSVCSDLIKELDKVLAELYHDELRKKHNLDK
jgi:hypothetical protein